MPWHLDEFLREKLERGKRLLAESEAYRGSTDLQKFVRHCELTTQLHNTLLDEAFQPRRGLTLQDKQQAMVVLMLDTLNNLPMPIGLSIMRPPCFDAARSVAYELVEGDPFSQWAGNLGELCLQWQAALNSPGGNAHLPALTMASAARMAQVPAQASTVVYAAFEAHQRQAGLDPALSAAQMRALPLFLQLDSAFRLLKTDLVAAGGQPLSPTARQHAHTALAAADTLQRLAPEGSASYLQCVRGDLLNTVRPAEAPAAYRAALQQAQLEKAHASAATAALSLIPALFSGGDGTRWFPREVQQVLADATQALAAAKAWLPKASFQSLQILLTQHKQMYDTIAGRVLAEFPWAAEIGLPAWPDAPFTAQNISTSAACSGCQRRTLQLRRCSGCRVCAYCSRECQAQHWRSVHKRECAALARQRQQQGQQQGQQEHSGNLP